MEDVEHTKMSYVAANWPIQNQPSSLNCHPMMLEVIERGRIKRWIRLEVTEPVTITTRDFIALRRSFTTYLIRIETNHYAFSLPYSEVRRRYSEFLWLRHKLAHHHPNKIVPPLPSKRYFSNYDSESIEERRAGLAKFLQRVMRSSVFLSDAALHLFLQSDMTIDEIEGKLTEEIPFRIKDDKESGNNRYYLRPQLSHSDSYTSSGSDQERCGSYENSSNSNTGSCPKPGGSDSCDSGTSSCDSSHGCSLGGFDLS